MKWKLLGLFAVLHFAALAQAGTGPYYLGNSYGNKPISDPLYSENLFDLFYPEGACPLSPGCDNVAHPVAVLIRGGNENAPLSGPQALSSLAQKLLSQNFVLVIPSYHIVDYNLLDDGVKASKDVGRMVQYLRRFKTIFNIDPNRVFCFGHSGGGYHAYYLGLNVDFQSPTSPDLVERQSSRPNYIIPWGAFTNYACFDITNPALNPAIAVVLSLKPNAVFLDSPTYWLQNPALYGRNDTLPMCLVYNLSIQNVCGKITDPHDGTFGAIMWKGLNRLCSGVGTGHSACSKSVLLDATAVDTDATTQAVVDWMVARAYSPQ